MDSIVLKIAGRFKLKIHHVAQTDIQNILFYHGDNQFWSEKVITLKDTG